jgi:hypothetical protein
LSEALIPLRLRRNFNQPRRALDRWALGFAPSVSVSPMIHAFSSSDHRRWRSILEKRQRAIGIKRTLHLSAARCLPDSNVRFATFRAQKQKDGSRPSVVDISRIGLGFHFSLDVKI